MTCNSSKDYFLGELRKLLQQLYDPAALRHSPFIALFGLKSQASPHTALRRILVEAIQALKPTGDVPPYANSWRIYYILQNRYVEHFSQQTLAANLGLSIRQLRRQERLAEKTLADYLWHKYNLEVGIQLFNAEDWGDQSGDYSQKGEELDWLRQSLPHEVIRVGEVITCVLRITNPLIRSLHVTVECSLPEGLPPLTGQIHIVKQGLLNLVSAAVQTAACGKMRLAVTSVSEGLQIALQATTNGSPTSTCGHAIAAQIEMAAKLIEMFGGRFEVTRDEGHYALTANVFLPVATDVPVLVIDDNADTLRLFERYLSGSRYHFVGVREPEQALALVEKSPPRIILLDIMLPHIDGWDALGRLREHPRTQRVPIIVCTIMPQEQLALMLGAAAFLRKPVTREQLLAALDQQLAESDQVWK